MKHKKKIFSVFLLLSLPFILFFFAKEQEKPDVIAHKSSLELEKEFVEGDVFLISSLTYPEMTEHNIKFFWDEGRIASDEDLEYYLYTNNIIERNKSITEKKLYFYKVYLNKEQLIYFKKHPEVFSMLIVDSSGTGVTN